MDEPNQDGAVTGSESGRPREKEEKERKAGWAFASRSPASGGRAAAGGLDHAAVKGWAGLGGGLEGFAGALASRSVAAWGLMGALVATSFAGVHTAVSAYSHARRAERARLFGDAAPKPSSAVPRPKGSSLYYLREANRGAFTEQAPAEQGGQPAAAADGAAAGGGAGSASDAVQAAAAAAAAAGRGGDAASAGRLARHPGFGEGTRASAGAGSAAGASGLARSGDAAKPDGAPPGSIEGFARPGSARKMKTAAVNIGRGARGPAGLKRLDTMNRAIGASAKSGNVQQASAVQTEQWSSAPGKDGVTGGGVSVTGAGTGQGARPGSDDPAFQIPTAGGGAPTGQDTGEDSGGEDRGQPPKTEGTPQTIPGINVTPWQFMVDMAQSALLLAAALIGVIAVVSSAKENPLTAGPMAVLLAALLKIAAGLAFLAMAVGAILVSQHGQEALGGIFLAGGALVTACALAALVNPAKAPIAYTAGLVSILTSATTFVASIIIESKV